MTDRSESKRGKREPLAFVDIEERDCGGATWIGLRARGAQWSWLTPDEALRLANEWIEKYGNRS